MDITWNHLGEADRIPPPSLIKEKFCMKLEKEDYNAALSCIYNQKLAESPEFSKKAWSKLLEENLERCRKGTLARLIQEVDNVIARSGQPNFVLENLLASCKELSRTCVAANVEPTETFTRD